MSVARSFGPAFYSYSMRVDAPHSSHENIEIKTALCLCLSLSLLPPSCSAKHRILSRAKRERERKGETSRSCIAFVPAAWTISRSTNCYAYYDTGSFSMGQLNINLSLDESMESLVRFLKLKIWIARAVTFVLIQNV
jgi:hypothetical protein